MTNRPPGGAKHREKGKISMKEIKLRIAKEFIAKYLEWLSDYNNTELADKDYGWKYGWRRGAVDVMKDTQKSMLWFQSHIFSGRHICGWEKEGVDRATVYALHRDGFFSYDFCTSHHARMLGKADFYYISQSKAKEIYKAYKNGFFNEA